MRMKRFIYITIENIDKVLTYINTLFALILIIGPWYIITETHIFPSNSSCTIHKGTVIFPFISEICNVPFDEIPDSNWLAMHVLVVFNFVACIILHLLHVYESYVVINKLGLLLQFLLLPIQAIILYIGTYVVSKPYKIDDSFITAAVITGISITSLRLLRLLYTFIKMDASSTQAQHNKFEQNNKFEQPNQFGQDEVIGLIEKLQNVGSGPSRFT